MLQQLFYFYIMQTLFEDNHLIAINKPAGVLTHSDKTGDETATDWVKQYIKKKYNKPGDVFLHPVHRLDRPTSGILLFARTSKALSRMTQQFKQRQPNKVYYALTDQKVSKPQGHLVNYLVKNTSNNCVQVTNKHQGKLAELDYEFMMQKHGLSLLKIEPKTGRSHQIRVQLANIGLPLIGDFKYGSKYKTDERAIGLHAGQLSFIHPVKKELITLHAALPDAPWWNLFK